MARVSAFRWNSEPASVYLNGTARHRGLVPLWIIVAPEVATARTQHRNLPCSGGGYWRHAPGVGYRRDPCRRREAIGSMTHTAQVGSPTWCKLVFRAYLTCRDTARVLSSLVDRKIGELAPRCLSFCS
jgi:hypothetical protein